MAAVTGFSYCEKYTKKNKKLVTKGKARCEEKKRREGGQEKNNKNKTDWEMGGGCKKKFTIVIKATFR